MIKDYDFRDFAGAAARAFNTLRFEPDRGLNQALQTIQQQRTANRAKNKTVEYLESLGTPMGNRLAAMVKTGQLKGSQAYGYMFDMEKEARAAERADAVAQRNFENQIKLANINRDANFENSKALYEYQQKIAADFAKTAADEKLIRDKDFALYEAKLDKDYPQADTSAFSAKFSRYKKAFPNLSDAEILEKMNAPDLPAEIRAIDARIKRMGIDPNSEAAKILYTYGEEGVQKFMIDTAKEAAKAAAQLPSAKVSYELATRLVDDLLRDPDLDRMVGPAQGRLPNVTGGAARVQSKIDQLVGQAYLQAREFLRGGGQITEKEADKAQDAFARFENQTMNDRDYRQALMDFRDAVQTGYEKMQAAAAKGEQILSLEKILGFDISGKIAKETQNQTPANNQTPTNNQAPANNPDTSNQEVFEDDKGKYILIDRGGGVKVKQRL